ncbi:replication-relaxation family protein [Streptomyces sp. NPDC047071]|uniref:replication-relaxation family protein n=1 Tax=Streptomyces sp. NPDC047071 TaxID=3154808 RepID=UPI0034569387
MAGARKSNPAGSTNSLRGDVLRVLGALKVATAEQIQQLTAPHLTYRHTDKATPSQRKQARCAAHLGALSDLHKHGLVENGGKTSGVDTLRNLTPAGLRAASYELGRPLGDMGGPARGAGRSGASHPMAVNETVRALLRPKPDLALLAGEPPHALAAAQAAAEGPAGLGTLASYATEVVLPATGTWSAPGKGGAQADIVLTAPEDGVPLLFVEVDNCYETGQVLAGKIEKYMRFFQRTVKDSDGTERPMWRTRWWGPDKDTVDSPHPPVLLVFNRLGPRHPETTIRQLAELTRRHWRGTADEDGTHWYNGRIPLVFTTMKLLQEHGPTGPVFRRFGRVRDQTLLDAIGNARLELRVAQQRAKYRVRQREHEEHLRRLAEQRGAAAEREEQQRKAEREARRPVCATCGSRCTDERWTAIEPGAWGEAKDSHLHLSGSCKREAVAETADTSKLPGNRCGTASGATPAARPAPNAAPSSATNGGRRPNAEGGAAPLPSSTRSCARPAPSSTRAAYRTPGQRPTRRRNRDPPNSPCPRRRPVGAPASADDATRHPRSETAKRWVSCTRCDDGRSWHRLPFPVPWVESDGMVWGVLGDVIGQIGK